MDVVSCEVVRRVAHSAELCRSRVRLILLLVDSLQGHEIGAVGHREIA